MCISQNDTLENGVITLPSGRTIRKLDNGSMLFFYLNFSFLIIFYYYLAPPINRRTWEAPPRAIMNNNSGHLSDRHLVAEVN